MTPSADCSHCTARWRHHGERAAGRRWRPGSPRSVRKRSVDLVPLRGSVARAGKRAHPSAENPASDTAKRGRLRYAGGDVLASYRVLNRRLGARLDRLFPALFCDAAERCQE